VETDEASQGDSAFPIIHKLEDNKENRASHLWVQASPVILFVFFCCSLFFHILNHFWVYIYISNDFYIMGVKVISFFIKWYEAGIERVFINLLVVLFSLIVLIISLSNILTLFLSFFPVYSITT